MSGRSHDKSLSEYWDLLCRIAGRTILTIQFLIRHWLATIAISASLAGAWWLWAWWGALLGLVPVATFWYARIALTVNASEASTWKAVIRGWWRERTVRKRWQHVMYQHKIHGRGDTTQVPRLVNTQPTNSGFVGDVITGGIALNAAKLTKLETDFASGFFVDRVAIKPLSPSMATIRFDWGQHLRQKFRLHDLPEVRQPFDKPALVRFAVQEDGQAATLVSSLSTLVGGLSGAGKSSTIWAIIAGYAEVVPLRLRIIDPSGVEFANAKKYVGQGLIHDYVSDSKQPGARKLEDFWADLERDFNRRMSRVEESGARWHKPTPQEPLDLVVIDEILPLVGQLKKDPTEHIAGRVLFLGRKGAFALIAASQVGQKETIGPIRDLFPQRLCHRTGNRYMTEAFLGDGAEADGASCSSLSVERDQGVLYIARAGESGYTAARSAWVSDSDTDQISRGLRPMPELENDLTGKETSLYAFYSAEADLLYVGIAESERLENRWKEHARSKPWWSEVAHQKELHRYPDRHMALTAEASMIEKKNPKYNIQHNTNMKRSSHEYA